MKDVFSPVDFPLALLCNPPSLVWSPARPPNLDSTSSVVPIQDHHFSDHIAICLDIQVLPKIGVTPKWMVYNGNPYFLMDDLGIPPFSETPIYRCIHSAHVNTLHIFTDYVREVHQQVRSKRFSFNMGYGWPWATSLPGDCFRSLSTNTALIPSKKSDIGCGLVVKRWDRRYSILSWACEKTWNLMYFCNHILSPVIVQPSDKDQKTEIPLHTKFNEEIKFL